MGKEVGEGRKSAPVTTFCGPGRWKKVVGNTERKER
jgi:hypothetical protein